MPYKKSNKQIQAQKLGPLKKNVKNLALNKNLDNDSESGGYTGQPKQHGSPFEMKAKYFGNSPMQKNWGDQLAINKKLDKDSMSGGLTGQPSGETGKLGHGPIMFKIGNPNNPMRQRFVKNVKDFGAGLKTAGKDIKYKLAGKTGRTKMVTGGYKTPKQRRATPTLNESTSSISTPNIKNEAEKFIPKEFKVTSQKDPYTYRTTKGGGFQFQSRGTKKGIKAGRTKGKWYTPKGGLDIIKGDYEKLEK